MHALSCAHSTVCTYQTR